MPNGSNTGLPDPVNSSNRTEEGGNSPAVQPQGTSKKEYRISRSLSIGGQLLSNVRVVMKGSSGAEVKARTDKDGKLEVSLPNDDSYELHVFYRPDPNVDKEEELVLPNVKPSKRKPVKSSSGKT
jgi:hypothetical protein